MRSIFQLFKIVIGTLVLMGLVKLMERWSPGRYTKPKK